MLQAAAHLTAICTHCRPGKCRGLLILQALAANFTTHMPHCRPGHVGAQRKQDSAAFGTVSELMITRMTAQLQHQRNSGFHNTHTILSSVLYAAQHIVTLSRVGLRWQCQCHMPST